VLAWRCTRRCFSTYFRLGDVPTAVRMADNERSDAGSCVRLYQITCYETAVKYYYNLLLSVARVWTYIAERVSAICLSKTSSASPRSCSDRRFPDVSSRRHRRRPQQRTSHTGAYLTNYLQVDCNIDWIKKLSYRTSAAHTKWQK